MPRQFGKVDLSASLSWDCPRCGHKHMSLTPCPPVGVWLVLVLCSHCNPKTGLYCRTHRAGAQQLVSTIPAPPGDDDEYRRRIGEEGAA